MKYKVILTKSPEVAGMLAKAHVIGEDGVNRISHGYADNYPEIPGIYHDAGLYACVITYEDSAAIPDYKLIIA